MSDQEFHLRKLIETLQRENAKLRDALAEIEAGSVEWKEEVARAAIDAAREEQP